MSEPTQTARHSGIGRVHVLGLLLVLISGAGVFFLWSRKHSAEAQDAGERHRTMALGPLVSVARVGLSDGVRDISLPGDVHAFYQATVYAKVSGYLKSIRVEIGDRVQANQVLGVIESPETEQQLLSARADVSVKQRTVDRYTPLVSKGVISQQEMDQAAGDLKVAETVLARALALREYAQIRAPFEGVVTSRHADPGALLPAPTTSTQGSLPLVDIANVDRVRVFVYLGQHDAPFVHGGDRVQLWTDDRPERKIDTTVTRVSHSLDPQTRTTTAEIVLDNRELGILPGTFVHVDVHSARGRYPLVPMASLIASGKQTVVARVEDGKIRFVPVEVGDQDGTDAQIISGLSGGEWVALNLPREVGNGAKVRSVVRQETKAK